MMAEGTNQDHPDHSAMQPLQLTTPYNGVGKGDLLPAGNTFNAGGFTALQYLSWLQSSVRMYSPQVAPNTCSYREQSILPLVGGDCTQNFNMLRPPTFDRQSIPNSIDCSNLVSTFSALMSTFSASRLTGHPYGSLPYFIHAPIPSPKTMPPMSAIQSPVAEYSSLYYQKQIFQQATSGRQSLMEIERFMTSNSVYNFHNTKKNLLDTANDNLLVQSPVGSTIMSQSMGSTVYTPPPSPRKVSEDLIHKETDVHCQKEATENIYNPDYGETPKRPTSNASRNNYSERMLYTCKWESCGKKFNRSVNLLSHQRTHQLPSVSRMESCGERPRQYLKQDESSRERETSYTCRWQFCKKSYKKLGFYLKHEQTHARSSVSLQPRRNKYKSFESSQNPSLLSHGNERKFVCKEKSCGKSYKRLHHLQRHEVSHTGEKNFICSSKFCDKSYFRLDNLQRHKVSHTGGRPFACSWNLCGKNYKRRDHLKRHERIHTGESFTCESPSCGKRFFRSDHLRNHQYTHSDEKRFKCAFCEKQFKRPKNLRYHEQSHSSHGDAKNNRRRTTRSSSSSFRNDGDDARSHSLRRSARRSCK